MFCGLAWSQRCKQASSAAVLCVCLSGGTDGEGEHGVGPQIFPKRKANTTCVAVSLQKLSFGSFLYIYFSVVFSFR